MQTPAPDLMSELLQGMRLRGIQHRRIRLAAPFCLDFPGDPGRAQFHFVAGGEVELQTPDGASHRLAPGAAVLLPHGRGHRLVSPGQHAGMVQCHDIRDLIAAPLCEDVAAIDSCDGAACGALLFSSCMELELGAMQGLVRLMPPAMLVTTLLDQQPELLPILTAMEAEACGQRLGHAAILARLADVVAATILRGWVESGCGRASGIAEAMRDPRLARALAALHRDPGRAWTVAELAAEMGSSRSIFAERFQAVTGVSPLRYVTELRMRLAQQWIGRERMPIELAASRLGYASQAAFSRAFKRVTGHPPGASRRPEARIG